MIIHLRQIQLTGSICFRLQKLIHVAVLGGFNSDLRISRGANQGTRRIHNPIDYDIGKALRPSYGGFIDPKNSNHTVALEEPFPALSKRLSLLGKKKKRGSLWALFLRESINRCLFLFLSCLSCMPLSCSQTNNTDS